MAAEIRGNQQQQGSVRKPQLINKLEGCQDDVNVAFIIPREDGVISVSDDRTVRVWLKRDTGQYWPSICHSVQGSASSLEYNSETRRMFVGLDNGTISEFLLADDYNSMKHTRDYLAHQNRVTDIKFTINCEWVLSVGRDKYFTWHCSETGRRLGGNQSNAWCTCLQFDEQSKMVFIGDYGGSITVLKVSDSACEHVTILKGHQGSVRSLSWDAEKNQLYSGSFDQSIIIWDIGGGQGSAFELQGHRDKVLSVIYAGFTKQLLSCGDDNMLVIWNMDVKRMETPEWAESDICEKCKSPFFWNVKSMWEQKTIGTRQHHCRKCGKAVCHKCSSKRSSFPLMGYEYPVRVCDDCLETITEEDRAPMASFHDVKHSVTYMHLDQTRQRLLTVGKDRVIKIWDVSSVLH